MAVHAVDSDGRMVTRKVVRRDALLRWMANCPVRGGDGGVRWAHYWARELTQQGHTVRIIAAGSYGPFARRKNEQ